MIQNQWYAVLSSRQVGKGKVVSVRRFGMNLVFFRTDAGTLACVQDACAHRGASLGGGCVRAGIIQCPFHGIEYDVQGRCVRMPSEGRASTKDFSRFNLKHYVVKELADIVFVWYGEGEPQGEPRPFEVLMDSTYAYDEIQDVWNVDYSRVIENQLDVSHIAFVHATTIGRGNKTLVNGPRVVWLDEVTLQTSANNEVDRGQAPGTAEDAEIRSTNLTFRFPNMWLNHVSDKVQIFAYFVPVDDEHAIICLRFYNKISGIKPIDKVIAWLGSRANTVVERQDKRVVETQLPKKTGMAIGERLVAADRPIIEYRRRRHELQQR